MEICSRSLAQRKYRYCFINYYIKAKCHPRSMPAMLGAVQICTEKYFFPKSIWLKQRISFQQKKKKKKCLFYEVKNWTRVIEIKASSLIPDQPSYCKGSPSLEIHGDSNNNYIGTDGLPTCIWNLRHSLGFWVFCTDLSSVNPLANTS